jgi:hypothetical protein
LQRLGYAISSRESCSCNQIKSVGKTMFFLLKLKKQVRSTQKRRDFKRGGGGTKAADPPNSENGCKKSERDFRAALGNGVVRLR